MNERREWFEMSLEELAEIERERNKLLDLIDLWVPVPYLELDGTWSGDDWILHPPEATCEMDK